jgi:hypothetical protein
MEESLLNKAFRLAPLTSAAGIAYVRTRKRLPLRWAGGENHHGDQSETS